VKKYVASSMADAMQKVRNELGEDAVILNSKVIYTRGFLGLFKKKNLEVIAAIDPQIVKEKRERKTALTQKSIQDKPVIEKKKIDTPPKRSDGVEKELKELKQMIQTLTSKSQYDHYPEEVKVVLTYLQQHDLEENLVFKMAEYLISNREEKSMQDTSVEENTFALAEKFLQDQLSDISSGGVTYQKKYINVIGPTGVGKTTTLAKMAAEAVIEKRKKIAFITTDTYRIAAIEQLKTYAQLLNVPVEVVYKIEDFKKAIDKFRDFDLVFIDTAGRNFREKKYVDDLQKIIDFNEEMETYLVLSLTSKENDLKEIIQQFSTIDINKFIFTKLDETSSYGTMINLMVDYKIGTAYVTTGQAVPEDIEEMSKERIVHLLFEGYRK
jgi:flagellar biosynthesis protein FlhF